MNFPSELKKQIPGAETLVRFKRWPRLKHNWVNKLVYIYSNEHFAFWRANAQGYTNSKEQAGVYTFEEAWAATNHCGPEKRIAYHLV